MEDDLKRRGQFEESSQDVRKDRSPSDYSSGTSRSALESHRLDHVAIDQLSKERVRLRDEDASLDGDDDDVDQPSYVIQSQDGKMRFYGWSRQN